MLAKGVEKLLGKLQITVATGYNEPAYTENWLYRTNVPRTDFFIIIYTGYNELY